MVQSHLGHHYAKKIPYFTDGCKILQTRQVNAAVFIPEYDTVIKKTNNYAYSRGCSNNIRPSLN